jgi:hypothetical protein
LSPPLLPLLLVLPRLLPPEAAAATARILLELLLQRAAGSTVEPCMLLPQGAACKLAAVL